MSAAWWLEPHDLLRQRVELVTVSGRGDDEELLSAPAHDQIVLGHADVILAGGVELLSDVPILHSKRFSQLLVAASKAKSVPERIGTLAKVRLKDLVPITPAIAEPSTGESMGQSAEKMAKEHKQEVIMVRPFTKPDDVHGMIASKGILTKIGRAHV